jgi:hypothetical protein
MFGIGVRAAIGRLLNDDQVSGALRLGGEEIQTGIMARCVDYDRDFRLRRLGLDPDQRAVAALYIFSKELQSKEYKQLEAAIRDYARRAHIRPPFSNVDRHLSWPDGKMTWTH